MWMRAVGGTLCMYVGSLLVYNVIKTRSSYENNWVEAPALTNFSNRLKEKSTLLVRKKTSSL